MASSKTMIHPPNGGGVGPQQRSALGRQGSVYSLTLEELQNSMLEQGKIGSMNMDEFMKNVWTAEENQTIFSTSAAAATNAASAAAGISSENCSSTTLQRQPSVSIPRTLSQKTVDEVWKEIQVQKQQQQQQQQDLSYGEMTLEDFLIHAGVVKEDTDAAGGTAQPIGPQGTIPNSIESMAQSPDWYSYQVKQQQLMHQAADFATKQQQPNLIGHPRAYLDSPYDAAAGGALSPGLAAPPETTGKKRGLELVVEKTVERRQRRMIKNRESAARSRARKQAYTVELEAELTQLKEENTRLKRWQAEEAERRRKQITEIFVPVAQQEQDQVSSSNGLQRCRSFP